MMSMPKMRVTPPRSKLGRDVVEYLENKKLCKPSVTSAELQQRLLLDGIVHPVDESADYFLLHVRLTVDSFHHGKGLKHALVAIGKVDDHYYICPQSIQSQLNAMGKGHCGKIMRSYLIIWRNRLKR